MDSSFEQFHFRTVEIRGQMFLNAKCPIMGERLIPLNKFLPVIRDQHEMLVRMRANGTQRGEEIDGDIAAYEAILNAPDPEARAAEYKDARQELRMRPREVARKKGWIP